jgi:hypothetical protein
MGDGDRPDAMKERWVRVKAIYDEIQHDSVSMPPHLEGLSDEDAVEEMRTWFFENFENPAESTPYESAEGGYIYIWGGPYETRDIIETVFSDFASEDAIEELVEDLDNEGPYWVPNSGRRQPPEPDDEEPSAADRHAQMLRKVSEIEHALEKMPETPAGIGHNMPPEPLEAVPFDSNDKQEIKSALAVLRVQPVEPTDKGKAASEALAKLETKRAKLGAWLLKQGEVFTTEAVKEAGKEFGKWAPRAFFFWMMMQLTGLNQSVEAWLSAIKHLLF